MRRRTTTYKFSLIFYILLSFIPAICAENLQKQLEDAGASVPKKLKKIAKTARGRKWAKAYKRISTACLLSTIKIANLAHKNGLKVKVICVHIKGQQNRKVRWVHVFPAIWIEDHWLIIDTQVDFKNTIKVVAKRVKKLPTQLDWFEKNLCYMYGNRMFYMSFDDFMINYSYQVTERFSDVIKKRDGKIEVDIK